MKYTDGTITIEAAQFNGDRNDTLNLQRIGFYPVITDIRDMYNPKLRIGIGKYINQGDYVIKNSNGKFIGCNQHEFLAKYKRVDE